LEEVHNDKVSIFIITAHDRKLDEEIAKFIISRRDDSSVHREKSRHRNILELALEDEEYGSQASIAELVDQIKTFLFAGHDTSASMVTWVYYYLGNHPRCLEKMKKEHEAVFGPNTDPAHIGQIICESPHLLGKLEYSTAAMRESLRLRTIADPVRETPNGYTVRTRTGAEFDIGDMIVTTNQLTLHKREDIWGPDSSEFEPERFMKGSRANTFAFQPFSKRPRDCIGKNLAYLEAQPVVSVADRIGESCAGANYPDF
jgi:cytochrome P450